MPRRRLTHPPRRFGACGIRENTIKMRRAPLRRGGRRRIERSSGARALHTTHVHKYTARACVCACSHPSGSVPGYWWPQMTPTVYIHLHPISRSVGGGERARITMLFLHCRRRRRHRRRLRPLPSATTARACAPSPPPHLPSVVASRPADVRARPSLHAHRLTAADAPNGFPVRSARVYRFPSNVRTPRGGLSYMNMDHNLYNTYIVNCCAISG